MLNFFKKMTQKVNPAGVSVESVWLNRGQEQSVKAITILAEELLDMKFDISAVQQPTTYDEAFAVFNAHMNDVELPKCPTVLKRSPMWKSLNLLAQALPLYAELRHYNNEEKNPMVNRFLDWFSDTVVEEFNQIVNQKQQALPENLPNQ